MKFLKRCWAEINLENIGYNTTEYRKYLDNNTELLCVVKADAYGHGDSIVVPYLQNTLGVKWFAVSNILEAVNLRRMGITGEILILGYTPAEFADDLVAYNIIQACTEYSHAEKLSAECTNGKVRIHAAVDTGMTRIGLEGDISQCCLELEKINSLPRISLEGIFTHYAVADGTDEESEKYTLAQTEKIVGIKKQLTERGINLPQTHFLNSAGGVYYSNSESTLARLGIIMYGLYPNPAKKLPFEPKPALTLKSAVSQIKYIEKGTDVSYGRTYTAPKKVKLATVTAGYADGYPRALSNTGEVLIHGKRCKITGRICMDQFMCDVTHIPDVKVDDEVVLIGEQGNQRITADDIADLTGTIGYEVTCDITKRVPRITVNG